MTTNFSSIIDRESWEAHVVDPFLPLVVRSHEGRKSPNRKNNLTERGFVIRDKITTQSVFLPIVGALEILKDMREVETWKTNGMTIGTPALSSVQQNEEEVVPETLHTPFVHQHPEYVLSDPLRLTPEQSKELFDFLLENERPLTELAEKDAIIARRQLTDMFKKIAEYGRRKRLSKSE